MALVVLAEALDGYAVACTVSEIDPQFGDRTAIVASSRDRRALDQRDGPLQIVLPGFMPDGFASSSGCASSSCPAGRLPLRPTSSSV